MFLKSVRNEQKDKKQTTKQTANKSPAEKHLDERFMKLIEVLEEHQDRIKRIEANLLSVARIIKAMRDDFSVALGQEPAPPRSVPPLDEQ